MTTLTDPLREAWLELLREGRYWQVPKILAFVEASRELWELDRGEES